LKVKTSLQYLNGRQPIMGGHSEPREFDDYPLVSGKISQNDQWKLAKLSLENCEP